MSISFIMAWQQSSSFDWSGAGKKWSSHGYDDSWWHSSGSNDDDDAKDWRQSEWGWQNGSWSTQQQTGAGSAGGMVWCGKHECHVFKSAAFRVPNVPGNNVWCCRSTKPCEKAPLSWRFHPDPIIPHMAAAICSSFFNSTTGKLTVETYKEIYQSLRARYPRPEQLYEESSPPAAKFAAPSCQPVIMWPIKGASEMWPANGRIVVQDFAQVWTDPYGQRYFNVWVYRGS